MLLEKVAPFFFNLLRNMVMVFHPGLMNLKRWLLKWKNKK